MKNKLGVLFIMFMLINGVALSQKKPTVKELQKQLETEQKMNKELKSLIPKAMYDKLDSLISVTIDLTSEIEKLKKDTANLHVEIDRLNGFLSLKNTQTKEEIKDVLLSQRIFTDESIKNKIKYLSPIVLAEDRISEIEKLELDTSKKKELKTKIEDLDVIIGEIEENLEKLSDEQKEYYKNNIRNIFDRLITKYF